MKKIPLFLISVAVLSAALYSCQHNASISLEQKVADAYGFSHFNQVKSLSYTFNIKRDSFTMSRSWKWFPQTHEVYFMSPHDTIHYRRDTIQSEAMKKIDQKFINDQYWLLFPFHLVWDKGDTKVVKYGQHMPMSGDTATCLTVAYSDSVGYTPHDSYDLFLDSLHQIREWNYRHNSVDTPSMSTTWGDVKDFNGIKIATTHYNKDSTFKLWFSGIKVEE